LIKEEELIPLKNNFKNFILMKKIIYLILCLATFSCSNENIGNDILSNAQEKGKGIIETSILPISNKFYTIGIRQ
jgi:hypothetical protein